MKKWPVLLVAVLTLSTTYAASFSHKVGIYHWGGRQVTSMSQGIEQITRHIARFSLNGLHHLSQKKKEDQIEGKERKEMAAQDELS